MLSPPTYRSLLSIVIHAVRLATTSCRCCTGLWCLPSVGGLEIALCRFEILPTLASSLPQRVVAGVGKVSLSSFCGTCIKFQNILVEFL